MAKILQFGTGRFLRGFFDCLIGQPDSIVVVQSRVNSDGAAQINAGDGGYHVWTRGKQNGAVVDRFERFESIERALVAHEQWPSVLQAAIDPELTLVVSNTTEQGLALDVADAAEFDFNSRCPASYPARLLALLHHRYRRGQDGLTILPLELIEYNAARLLALVKQQAEQWTPTREPEFLRWLENENRWLSNLVDRIVVAVSETPPWTGDDPLAVVAEPFRMLAVEDDGGPRDVLPDHEMVQWVEDLERLFVRKVRILNGLHTAMVAHSLPRGLETVLDAVRDPTERAWLESLLFEEILPALAARDMHEEPFARKVLERFENPFFRHRLSDIANGHTKKLATRIAPTLEEFKNAFGRIPEKLTQVMDASIVP